MTGNIYKLNEKYYGVVSENSKTFYLGLEVGMSLLIDSELEGAPGCERILLPNWVLIGMSGSYSLITGIYLMTDKLKLKSRRVGRIAPYALALFQGPVYHNSMGYCPYNNKEMLDLQTTFERQIWKEEDSC